VAPRGKASARRFARVPIAAASDQGLSTAGYRLLGLLCGYIDDDDRCWPSVPTLASKLGIVDRAVQFSLKELVATGYIRIERRAGKPNVYLVLYQGGETRLHPTTPETTLHPSSQGGETTLHPTPETRLHPNYTTELHSKSPTRESESNARARGRACEPVSNGVNGEPYAFAGTVIKLNHTDFERWRKAYTAIDITAELQSLDDWFVERGVTEKWFVRTSANLRKAHQKALAEGREVKPKRKRRQLEDIPEIGTG